MAGLAARPGWRKTWKNLQLCAEAKTKRLHNFKGLVSPLRQILQICHKELLQILCLCWLKWPKLFTARVSEILVCVHPMRHQLSRDAKAGIFSLAMRRSTRKPSELARQKKGGALNLPLTTGDGPRDGLGIKTVSHGVHLEISFSFV